MIYRSLFSFAGTCITALIFNTFLQYNAFADNQIQSCKIDDGLTWYFSLGRTVFEMSSSNFIGKNSQSLEIKNIDPEQALIPPNPNIPVGCRDNPQQLVGIKIGQWPTFGKYDYPEQDFPGQMPHSPNLIELRYDLISASKQKKEGKNVLFPSDNSCGSLKFQKIFRDGSIYCTRDAQGLTNPDPWSSGWILLVPNNIYPLPLSWEHFELLHGFSDIETRYWLTDFIQMNYKTLFPSLPLSSLAQRSIDFDRAVRASIMAAELQNYNWPTNPDQEQQ